MTQSRVRSPRRQVPTFATWKEEAEFWDTHDVTDYWDDSQVVDVEVGNPLSDGILLPLDIFDMAAWRELGAHADKEGIDPAILIQRWILERLEAERQRVSDETR